MSTNNALAVYLNDHLAGSEAALELLAHLADGATSSDLRARFVALRAEIEEDQTALRGLLARIGEDESSVKRALGWLAEKATRLKLGVTKDERDAFALFESLEILALGIEGKRSLWRALAVIAASDPRLAGLDVPKLMERATQQHDEVERLRLEFAIDALAPPEPAGGRPR